MSRVGRIRVTRCGSPTPRAPPHRRRVRRYEVRRARMMPDDVEGLASPPTHTVGTTFFDMWLGSLSTNECLSISVV